MAQYQCGAGGVTGQATFHRRGQALVWVLALLTGCVGNGGAQQVLLDPANSPPWAFPEGYEFQASVTLATTGSTTRYVLALNTALATPQLALLTPQGLPVYSASEHQYTADRPLPQLASPAAPSVLDYLALAYWPEENLRASLSDAWQLGPTSAMRVLYNAGGAAAIIVHYSGHAPWYSSVRIEDDSRSLSITFSTIEAKRVLPK